MSELMIRMLTACLAISAMIGFMPPPSIAQPSTPIVDADRAATEAARSPLL